MVKAFQMVKKAKSNLKDNNNNNNSNNLKDNKEEERKKNKKNNLNKNLNIMEGKEIIKIEMTEEIMITEIEIDNQKQIMVLNKYNLEIMKNILVKQKLNKD